MKSQNGESGNFSGKPVEPAAGRKVGDMPAGPVSSKGRKGAGRRNSRWTSVTKTSTRELKRIHGECKGENPAVADELRRRGFNSRMLEQIQWEWGQQQWEKAAKRASKISTARNGKARREKKRAKEDRRRERSRERQRQEQQARLDRLKKGVQIVGEKYDPSAADGSCPF
jgi:hypothetical protein